MGYTDTIYPGESIGKLITANVFAPMMALVTNRARNINFNLQLGSV